MLLGRARVNRSAVTAVDVVRPSGEYRSLLRRPIRSVSGEHLADLSLAPGLLVRQVLAEQVAAPGQRTDDRLAAIATAGELFATATLAGESPEDYCHAQARCSGAPSTVARRGLALIASCTAGLREDLARQRPAGVTTDWRQALRTGRPLWSRRGRTLAVSAAGNHPGAHAVWLPALGLGYRVALRPSHRDPFTARRLVHALRAAGLAPAYCSLLPTEHDALDTLVAAADLAVLFGGPDLQARYGDRARVRVEGPGRAKILVGRDTDPRTALDVVAASVADQGGVLCTSATAVFAEHDPAGLAAALADRLSRLPALPPEHPRAALPVLPAERARAITATALRQAGGAPELASRGALVAELGDGSAALRPAVFLLDRVDHPAAGVELPFPCVWVLPWSPRDGVRPLRGSLALTVLGADDHFFGRCAAEPTIRLLHRGPTPTWDWPAGSPHDGYPGEFLMRAKTLTDHQLHHSEDELTDE
ncbi:aldehyde dehydrogenase family protein [Kitasatospora sp. NPDC052896]|uniref:aldehyde dehydrogenase family protein n=1 Tax=Kitasatospora sp. NPDC052896 TaxID=3364061 RepID=UPI0037C9338E